MSVRTFVFDLDGVVYRGEQPLPGAIQTIETLRRLGHKVYFFTNNSARTRTDYLEKLTGMGISCDCEHIMTSSYATALYMVENRAQGKAVFVIGHRGIREELLQVGMRVSDDGVEERVDFVVVGVDRQFSYEKLTKAQQAILAGAQFVATNRDATFPLENGRVVPGGGAMVAAVEVAVGKAPLLIGKPSTYAMRKVLELAGSSPENAVIIGDRLDTDILVGRRTGVLSVLVTTGVTTRTDLELAPSDLQPDIVIDNLSELLELDGARETVGKA